MQKRHLTALLLAVALLQAVPASAEGLIITPPCETTLYYHVGTVNVHFDRSCTGGNFSIYRAQPEGEFLYYTYDPVLINEAEMHCELIEGVYKLEVTLPSDEGFGVISYPPVTFTIQDPDMDESQSFDESRTDIYITCDPDAETDTLVSEEPVTKNRIIRETHRLTLARRQFLLGDIWQDGSVDAGDAAKILVIASLEGAGGDAGLSSMQQAEADVNADGEINAQDASIILRYAASCAAGNFSGDLADFIRTEREV